MSLNYYDDSPIWVPADDRTRDQLARALEIAKRMLKTAEDRTRDRDQLARQLEITERARKTAEAAVDKLLEATGGATPEYQRQDAFTICVLVDPVSERVFTGAACCGPQDTFNLEIGKAISLGRAMNQRAEYFANAAYAK